MSGHSKWSTIKRKKGKEDAKRGQIFSKLARVITVAAREGGGNISSNVSLSNAVEKAKQHNMPQDNIEKAIKKGIGEVEGAKYEQILYEGYGPEGVAIMVNVLTDNRKRSASEVRYIFTKHNGNLGTSGSVSWIFENKGIILVQKDASYDEEKLLEIALEAGADDIKEESDHFEITCSPNILKDVVGALKTSEIKIISSESTMLPKNTAKLDKNSAAKLLKLVDSLEDNDDVQEVYANFDISDEILEELT